VGPFYSGIRMELETKILYTPLAWPVLYRMFSLLFINQKQIKKNSIYIESRYIIGNQFKKGMAYTDVPLVDRSFLLLSRRTEDILAFCKSNKLPRTASVVKAYLQSKPKGTPIAVREYYSSANLAATIAEVLQEGLTRQYPSFSWRVDIDDQNSWVMYVRRDKNIKSIKLTRNLRWTDYKKFSKELANG